MPSLGLIVGLGNPGTKYEGTRHNIGFLLLDALMRSMEHVSSLSSRFNGELWKASFSGLEGEWILAKPQTFMNLSGECVQPLAAWHRIDPSHILVIHDELDLPAGRMKFKIGGGNAGHNGLKSITERLGTPNFARLRIGIGRSPAGRSDDENAVVGWVLGRPIQADREAIQGTFENAFACVRAFARGDIQAATTIANGHK